MTKQELFEKIYAEERKNVPNRESLSSAVINSKALPATIVRYIETIQEERQNGKSSSNSESKKRTRRSE